MRRHSVLVTGFEPYGGRSINPSAEVAKRLDGSEVEGVPVVGRLLPVTFNRLKQCVTQLLAETNPIVVVNLGLWPGEPMIRLERVAFNLIDCEIPDNEGMVLEDVPVEPTGAVALPSRLPLRTTVQALLDAGIPARLSATAGTFLCNATMYAFLEASQKRTQDVPCGFVHLPYLPEQVADLLKRARVDRTWELHQRADLSSMSLETMTKAVQIVLRTALAHTERTTG